MSLYIDKKVEEYELSLKILLLKKNSSKSRLDFTKDLNEREIIQAEINSISEQIIDIEKTIATYYPKI